MNITIKQTIPRSPRMVAWDGSTEFQGKTYTAHCSRWIDDPNAHNSEWIKDSLEKRIHEEIKEKTYIPVAELIAAGFEYDDVAGTRWGRGTVFISIGAGVASAYTYDANAPIGSGRSICSITADDLTRAVRAVIMMTEGLAGGETDRR